MAMEAEAVMRRPFVQAAAGGDGEVVSAAGGAAPAPAAFLAAETTTGRAVDPVIWGDEKRMKRELVAWAKAVASMAAAGNNTSPSTAASSPWPTSIRRRGESSLQI
ncbi:unnamed protein product [Urochloa decumbens]|uniref:Uncharacterized protein n=1 Tax=Urochloa decumbens TaxID=240449 RepID=A0ABC9GU93_9POAL